MNSTNPDTGLKNREYKLLDDRKNLMDTPHDLENIFSLIRMKSTDPGILLEKVKSIVNLLHQTKNFELLKNTCLKKNNGGKRVKIGYGFMEEYRLISISADSYNSLIHNIIAKLFPRNNHLCNEPGTIKNFSLKKVKLRSEFWENCAEINILSSFEKEYYVKINFFTYN